MDTNTSNIPGERPWQTDLLVCAATWMELRAWWPRDDNRTRIIEEQMAYSPALTFALTGVGIPATLERLFTLLQEVRPARILNIGIAGAYPNSGLSIGDIVVGTSEMYGDVGFELPPADKYGSDKTGAEDVGFQSIQTSPFLKQMPFGGQPYAAPLPLTPFYSGWTEVRETTPYQALPEQGQRSTLNAQRSTLPEPTPYQVRLGQGCTVNACTGTIRTGLLREQLFGVQFESMEGAAVAQAGLRYRIPVCEIRAISNFASTRDMQPDNIRLAIANLRDYLEKCRVSGICPSDEPVDARFRVLGVETDTI